VEHLYTALAQRPDYTKLCLLDELVWLFAGHGQHKPGQSGADADITAVLLMKDGSALRSSTVVGGTRAVPMSHVTFAGGMQEQKFVQYLGNANSASVGLIGRFLPLWPPATNKDLDNAAAVWKEHSGAAVGTPLPVSVLQVACPYLLL
jgi:Protein of unknown function (DUF3987)